MFHDIDFVPRAKRKTSGSAHYEARGIGGRDVDLIDSYRLKRGGVEGSQHEAWSLRIRTARVKPVDCVAVDGDGALGVHTVDHTLPFRIDDQSGARINPTCAERHVAERSPARDQGERVQ